MRCGGNMEKAKADSGGDSGVALYTVQTPLERGRRRVALADWKNWMERGEWCENLRRLFIIMICAEVSWPRCFFYRSSMIYKIVVRHFSMSAPAAWSLSHIPSNVAFNWNCSASNYLWSVFILSDEFKLNWKREIPRIHFDHSHTFLMQVAPFVRYNRRASSDRRFFHE